MGHYNAMTPVSSLPNLGPAMEKAFGAVGIHSAEALRELGADAAYARLLENGQRPHFIAYYVVHMALQGRPWTDCKASEKQALRYRFDALKIGTTARVPVGIEAELGRLGVGDPQRR